MTTAQSKYLLFMDSELLVWAQLADHLTTRINAGEFDTHEALPTKKALAEEYGVSLGTVRRGLADLLRRKVVIQGHGGRLFVNVMGEADTIRVTRHLWRQLVWECRDNPDAMDILELEAPRAWVQGFRADVRREALSETTA